MPPRTRARARVYDSATIRAALTAQLGHIRQAVAELDEERLGAPTRLGDWTARELLTHVAATVDSVARLLAAPAPPAQEAGVNDYAAAVASFAGAVDERTRAAARDTDPRVLLERAEVRFTETAAAAPGDRLLAVPVGAMRLDDYLVTRCVELVVHSDDLAAATGTPVPYDRQAMAAAVRMLADALAAKAPGGSVEVRIPPYAVVQCVEGPRHTRGTPPNVVETDPLTWVRLATGRTGWAEALEAAEVSAGGERADLAAHLPVLA
ncbi:maleylpyruvate isomerase family mycothiol-dependent enzyme [Streptomyces coffeae]|uniref:Maleylpyruvate isomerase family mycothiol-dependent enzyme n=1 Tax=Streptomyces coffeae TaxID=621382 RepID=A0ABS1N7G2_9ACTN|nr:maleylpyruvate isomerase family mycothiol-dependent enzyme [Streptomyces coffeae]MBL1096020.1 maleylpyruvate isomerase family mycothiol-dependent enzyme [Streptomyces coffeae]